MGRFFNPNKSSIVFPEPNVAQGGGGGGDPLAGEKYKRRENERLFSEAQVSNPNTTPPEDSQTPVTMETARQADIKEGDTTFNPEKYAQALDKSYGLEKGNAYRLNQMQLDHAKDTTDLENWRAGAMLISAGRKREGLELINMLAPEGKKVKDIIPGREGNFLEINEDGSKEVVNMDEVIASLVTSKDLFNAQQQWKIHLLTKQTKKEPLELKADELVSPNGQVFNMKSIMEVYKDTFDALKKIQADPLSIAFLRNRDPEEYNRLIAAAASIPTPVAWAKEVYGVDITGKAPGRTVPAEKAGGKIGAKTPQSGGWMDAMPDASQYKGNRIKSSTGEVLISDGTTWIPEAEFKKKQGKK